MDADLDDVLPLDRSARDLLDLAHPQPRVLAPAGPHIVVSVEIDHADSSPRHRAAQCLHAWRRQRMIPTDDEKRHSGLEERRQSHFHPSVRPVEVGDRDLHIPTVNNPQIADVHVEIEIVGAARLQALSNRLRGQARSLPVGGNPAVERDAHDSGICLLPQLKRPDDVGNQCHVRIWEEVRPPSQVGNLSQVIAPS